MASYSDAEFTSMADDKPGNIRLFRRKLKKYNQLRDRQQLNDEHLALFIEIKQLKEESGIFWDEAMEQGISNYVARISNEDESASILNTGEEVTLLSVLSDISRSLKNIEELLRTRN